MSTAVTTPAAGLARRAGLVYVTDRDGGYRRRRTGKNVFRYYWSDTGLPVSRKECLRIRALAIPPAYRDVWICSNPRGHLQATGRDDRGRKQYRYHPVWRQTRDREKFSRIARFATALPKLRRQVARDLALEGLPRQRIVATVVHLLATTRVRVGNDEYAQANNTFGLTTLRDRHVRFSKSGLAILEFAGKNGTRTQCVSRHDPSRASSSVAAHSADDTCSSTSMSAVASNPLLPRT